MDHSEFHRPTWPALLVGVAAFLLISIAGRAQGEVSVRADDPQLSASARAVPHDGTLRLESLFLETRGEMDLELTRFPVFTDDAVILAGEKSIQVPEHAYFRGSVVGLPSSRAVLSFKTSGVIDGLIISDGELWHLSSRAQQAGLSGLRLDILEENADRPFECQTDRLGSSVPVSLPESLMPGAESSQPRAVSYSYSARVAVDTDWEFLNKFGGDVNAATDYVGDLFAFSSAIYEDEVDTSLHVSYLKWWPGPDNGSDPWSQSGCSSALSQFRSYWNSNHGSTERTVAHLMSGKNTGCGIAYVGVLCNASYGYGVTGSLSGNFDPLDPMSGSGFWDILAVSHEIGHNFGSSHTHCYQGVPNSGYPGRIQVIVATSRTGGARDGAWKTRRITSRTAWSDEITRPTVGVGAAGQDPVLGGDRSGSGQRGRCERSWGIAGCRIEVVSAVWRDATPLVAPRVGSISVVCRARGDRHPAGSAGHDPRDRSTPWSLAVDDLAGAATQRVDTQPHRHLPSDSGAMARGAPRPPAEGVQAWHQQRVAQVRAGSPRGRDLKTRRPAGTGPRCEVDRPQTRSPQGSALGEVMEPRADLEQA